jgi:histidinol phosphatase-like PHP family hydrolase
LTLPELVDLYGRSGFDELAVTDHVVRSDDPWRPPDAVVPKLRDASFQTYLAEIETQTKRARRQYDLLVIPGLELTYNDFDPFVAAHAVAIGCRFFISVDAGVDPTLAEARARRGGARRRPPVSRRRQRVLACTGDAALLP